MRKRIENIEKSLKMKDPYKPESNLKIMETDKKRGKFLKKLDLRDFQ